MQNRPSIPSHTGQVDSSENQTACAFCKRSELSYILKETSTFLVAADHAPLVEGHILIIPKKHYTCYGDVPSSLDAELASLKQEIRQFLLQYYAPVVFWEHGVFHQTVYHAHLHCFPFGITRYETAQPLHNLLVHSQEDIRTWYSTQGHYFYLEDTEKALLFAPENDRYMQVIKEVFWPGVSSKTGQTNWRSSTQRREEGKPLIEALAAKWRSYQG